MSKTTATWTPALAATFFLLVLGFLGPMALAGAAGDGLGEAAEVRTGWVHLEVTVPRGNAVLTDLEVHYAAAQSTEVSGESTSGFHQGELAAGATSCRREGFSWWCEVPSGRHDLRFRAPGFASALREDVVVPAGASVDVGRVTLIRGASVLGRVALPPGGGAAAGEVLVVLRPETPAPLDPAAESSERTARLLPGGWFQFWEVDPGLYRVAAQARGWALDEVAPVAVAAGQETELDRPLRMLPPADLELCLTPADPPGLRRPGDTWRPVLYSEEGAARPPVDGCLSTPGCYGWAGLPPGRYRLAIEDLRGSLWWEQSVSLAAGSWQLQEDLPLVEVAGTLTWAGRPVRARLEFSRVLDGGGDGGQIGGERTVVLYSGPDGSFDGALPGEGRWWVKVAFTQDAPAQPLAEVTVRKPESGPARLTLVLPGASPS